LTAVIQGLHRFRGLRPDFPGSALSAPCPKAGPLTTRQASLDAADRTVASPKGLLTLGFDPARFQTEPPACYRASWQLPGPDLHRQATTSFRFQLCSMASPPTLWTHEELGLIRREESRCFAPMNRCSVRGTAVGTHARCPRWRATHRSCRCCRTRQDPPLSTARYGKSGCRRPRPDTR
jgi:hypothetical protein